MKIICCYVNVDHFNSRNKVANQAIGPFFGGREESVENKSIQSTMDQPGRTTFTALHFSLVPPHGF